MATADGIRPSIEGPLAALGVVVEDITVTPAGRRRVVRIAVDRDLGDLPLEQTEVVLSLTLDEVAEATRTISDALDDDGTMGEQPYTLEVSSPGVDRPLTEPRHYRRNATRLLTLTLHEGEPVTGHMVRAGVEDMTIVVPAEKGHGQKKSPERTVLLTYAEVERAVVQVEFSRRDVPAEDPDDDQDDQPDAGDDEEQEA